MLLTLATLNASDRAAFTAALGHLFEHSPWVAEETWVRRPFRDAAHLHAELCATMRAVTSVTPPGVKPTTMRTDFVG